MIKYKFEGYDKNSVAKNGSLEAEDFSKAYNVLKDQNITVVNLEPEKVSMLNFFEEYYLKFKLDNKWLSVFFRELSVMSGTMELQAALETLKNSTVESLEKKLLDGLFSAIQNGISFDVALSSHKKIFADEIIQSVKIASESGNSEIIYAQLAERLERSYTIQKKISSAMYYPIVVLIAAIVAAIVMINFTLPVFENFYTSQGAELPLITLVLLRGGDFFMNYFLLIIFFLLVTIFFAIIIYHEVAEVRYFLAWLKWQIKIFREVELRNFFGNMKFLIDIGKIPNEAINLYSNSSSNLYLKKKLQEVQILVKNGKTLSASLKESLEKIPVLYLNLIMVGEESGNLTKMLRQCETMADFEVDEILRALPAKAEVYGTLIAGIIVGALVFAIVLPILNITTLF